MSILDATLREQDRLNGIAAALDDTPASVLDQALQEIVQPKSEPEPLRRPLAPPSPYPLDALGPVLSGAAKRIHEVVQAPAALCGQSVLAAAALAAQPHANVVIDGRTEPLSLYAVTIAESGERKTGIDRHALSPHKEHERMAMDCHRQEMQSFELDRDAYECARKGKAIGKDPDTIRAALGSLGAPPAEPLKPIMLVPSPTFEGIQKLYATGKPSLGLFHDDGGEFIGGHALNKDNKMKTASGLSRLWDFGEFDRVRAGDGANKYFGRRLSLHLMIQPVIAETILADDILTRQGLLARALLVWPTSTIGQRNYVETDLRHDPAMWRYWTAVANLLEREPILRAGTTNELVELTRFCGHIMFTKGGSSNGSEGQAVHAGVSAADGRAASKRALVQRAGAAVRVHELVDPHVGQAGGSGPRSRGWRPDDGGARRAHPIAA